MSRAAHLDCQHGRSCALVLTLILFQKGQGFFPPLPIAALLPRSRRRAGLPLAGWDGFMRVGLFWKVSGQRVWGKRAMGPVAILAPAVGGGQAYPLRGFCFHRSRW